MSNIIEVVNLPKCVYKKHGAYYLVKGGKWYWLTRYADRLDSILRERFGIIDGHMPYGRKWFETGITAELIESAYKRARNNAKGRRKKEFTLTLSDVEALFRQSGGKCTVTGVPFSTTYQTPDGKRPFAPSIDRVDSMEGYTPENCRLVCMAANIAMNTWGEGVLLTILKHAKGSRVLDIV